MPVQKVVSKGLYGIEVEQVHGPSLGRPASRDHGLCGGFGKSLSDRQDYVCPAGQSQRNAASPMPAPSTTVTGVDVFIHSLL